MLGNVKKRSQKKSIFLFMLPTLILLAIFFLVPTIVMLILSFTNMSLIGPHATHFQFIGFKNFTRMFSDPYFAHSIWITLIFLFASALIGQQVLGFLLAYLMRKRNGLFNKILGTAVMAGWVVPVVVGAFIFLAFYSYHGTLNSIIHIFGISPISWIFAFPLTCIIIANIWKGTAFSMLIFGSGLGSISSEVEEAAVADGANKWQKLRYVILPMMKNLIVTNMILNTLSTLTGFGLVYALTAGGPGHATQILPLLIYDKSFVSYQLAYGVAISLILLLICIGLSIIYLRVLKSEV